MLARELMRSRCAKRRFRQRGATVVEFALIALLFFSFLFAVIELARIMFLFNTLEEVTRRAANATSVSDPSSASTISAIRISSIFRNTSGGLALMPGLTDEAVRIDYGSVSRSSTGDYTTQFSSTAAPTSASENRQNCAADPYASNCIRLVRVRICDPAIASSCEAMKFQPLTTLFGFEISLPLATTIVKAQSFGQNPG